MRASARSSLPALPGLDHEGGAGERGEREKNPEGPRLQQSLHVSPTASQRRGSVPSRRGPPRPTSGASGSPSQFRLLVCNRIGVPVAGRSVLQQTPGFASPPRDGFALIRISTEVVDLVMKSTRTSDAPPWPSSTTPFGGVLGASTHQAWVTPELCAGPAMPGRSSFAASPARSPQSHLRRSGRRRC